MATRILVPTVHEDGTAVALGGDEGFVQYFGGTPPALTVFNGGGTLWSFLPSAGDESVMVAYLIDLGAGDGGGAAKPQRVFGTVPRNCRRQAIGFRDGTGNLVDNGLPAFISYTKEDGTALTAPSITDTGEGWYHFLIPEAEADAGVRWAVQVAGGGAVVEPVLCGNFKSPVVASSDVDPPTITVIGPPSGSAITANQAIQVRVTDGVALRRSIVTARFGGLSVEDVVWNGDRFGALYLGSTKTTIAGGYELTIRRTGGWPGGPVLDVFAIDTSGNEA